MAFYQDINLLKNSCGIYMIYNKINHKKYIGSTSKNFYQRWTQHLYQLNSNNHYNKYLQYSWNKYSYNNFKFVIIKTINKINNVDLLKQIIFNEEQKYLDLYHCYNPYGYNLTTINSPHPIHLKLYYLNEDDIYTCQDCIFYNQNHSNTYKKLYFCDLNCTNYNFDNDYHTCDCFESRYKNDVFDNINIDDIISNYLNGTLDINDYGEC
ncbi:MAG: GIY-YIG nuclease family protein [Syntrophothermus sp.]